MLRSRKFAALAMSAALASTTAVLALSSPSMGADLADQQTSVPTASRTASMATLGNADVSGLVHADGLYYDTPAATDDDDAVRFPVRTVVENHNIVHVQRVDYAVKAVSRRAVSLNVPNSVALNHTFMLTAKVPVKKHAKTHRAILIQQHVGKKWVTLIKTKAKVDGTVQHRMPASGSPFVAQIRVLAPKAKGLPQAVSPTRTISFGTPAEVATNHRANSAKDWVWLDKVDHSRWYGGCTLTWAYKPTGGYAGAEADVRQAFARTSAATQFRFQQVSNPADATIVVGWATPKQDPALTGSTVGITHANGAYSGNEPMHYTDVQINFDLTAKTPVPGWKGTAHRPQAWGSVMMHEIGHAMGLGHAAGNRQVMYGGGSTAVVWGAGDRSGLNIMDDTCNTPLPNPNTTDPTDPDSPTN